MYSNNIPRLLQLLLIVVALACLPVQGQTDQGRIVGTVTDSNGAIVPGATVSIGLLRQTVERTVGLGTNRQIQFARLNF